MLYALANLQSGQVVPFACWMLRQMTTGAVLYTHNMSLAGYSVADAQKAVVRILCL